HSLGHIPLKEPVMLQSKANAANEIELVQSNPVGSAEVAHLENAEEALNTERPDKSVISSGFEENTTTGTSDNKKPLTLASEVSTTHGLDIQPANTPEKFEYAASGNEPLFEKSFIETSLGYGPVSFGKQLNSQRNNRWAIQVYATPSISYRYLLEDNKYVDDPSSINGPLAPYITNSVNQFVRHNAKMGMEIGASVLYRLSDNFRLKTGLQINYRQYGIEAYATNMQPAILTLNRGNGIDSVVRFTNISSQTGYRELNLSSNSLQVAIPIGFDLKMAQLNKFGFFISASGQLTYQLSNNSYVLSADYKNYMKQPELDRKFNINTAVEAFVSFDAGGVTWQAGPQIRYQMLPGTTSAYPIREHLIDYGLKVGVVKTLK
ncbi:MAG: PorT family protein, partial [Chitinophagaceae bacterium]|nr:PorT family protein [Chitinophagaceae bacterium]